VELGGFAARRRRCGARPGGADAPGLSRPDTGAQSAASGSASRGSDSDSDQLRLLKMPPRRVGLRIGMGRPGMGRPGGGSYDGEYVAGMPCGTGRIEWPWGDTYQAHPLRPLLRAVIVAAISCFCTLRFALAGRRVANG
jgi:hypothetical protein